MMSARAFAGAMTIAVGVGAAVSLAAPRAMRERDSAPEQIQRVAVMGTMVAMAALAGVGMLRTMPEAHVLRGLVESATTGASAISALGLGMVVGAQINAHRS